MCSEFNIFSHAAGFFRKQARPLNYLFFPKPEEKYAKESQTKYCNVCRHMTKRKFRVHDILAIDVVFRKIFAFEYFPLYLRPHAIIKRRGSEYEAGILYHDISCLPFGRTYNTTNVPLW